VNMFGRAQLMIWLFERRPMRSMSPSRYVSRTSPV
jgi:hypothetical protein